MFLIDTHSHLNFNAYKDDGDKVIRRALDNGIQMINVGSQYDTSKRAVEIAEKYKEGIYAAVGLHPIHLFDLEVDEEKDKFHTKEEEFDEKKYQMLVDSSSKVAAIGEIGFDFYHLPAGIEIGEAKEIQKKEFIKQIEFAKKNKLPVILHCRGTKDDPLGAYNDLLDTIKSLITHYPLPVTGVVHCFTADTETARKFIALGFYIGFTGIITFGKNADSVREVVKNIPIEKILVETDCPYLSPDPHRGERNEPSFVEFVAKKVAEIKNLSFDETAKI
ncbi:MAG: TatD family hydrolase, partial [Candidatus Kuenenbacteria bacterium]